MLLRDESISSESSGEALESDAPIEKLVISPSNDSDLWHLNTLDEALREYNNADAIAANLTTGNLERNQLIFVSVKRCK